MTCPNPADVYGLHFSPIAIGEGPLTVTGLSLGAVDSLVMDEVRGIQVAGLFSFGWPSGPDKTRIYGCQLGGVVAGADCVTGIQAAGAQEKGSSPLQPLQANIAKTYAKA